MGGMPIIKNADVAKLADAQVSGSCGRPYGFESLHPHQRHPERGAFFVGADEGKDEEAIGSREQRQLRRSPRGLRLRSIGDTLYPHFIEK